MPAIHTSLAAGRWQTLTLMQQLGNIGSEVERSLRARESGDAERFARAADRMLELLDLTIQDPRNRTRLKEPLRIREVVCDYFFGSNSFAITADQLRKDFLAYGVAARMGR